MRAAFRVLSDSDRYKTQTRRAGRKRPSTLAYDVDEVPPRFLALAMATQHVLAMSVGWIYVIVAVDAIGASRIDAQSLLRLSMIASGLTTILQARSGWIGSGYLCPASCSLTYLAPAILAGRLGGLPLMFGMTAFNGAFTAVLSRFLRTLRALFPPDVTGLILSIVGIQLVAIGCPKLLGRSPAHPEASLPATIVGLVTLFAMIAPSVWAKGKLRLFPVFIGLVVGHIAALVAGILSWTQIREQWTQPLFSVPHRVSGGITFQPSLLLPFLIIGVSATLKTVGDLTLCQKMNDADWKRTDMESVSGDVMANSLGTLFSGLIGGFPQNNASSCLGLEIATGVMSRSIAVPAGILMMLLALVPGLAATFSIMPPPVMGALLIYATCYLMLGGLQVMTARMLDSRRIFAIDVALTFGLSVEIAPEIYSHVPAIVRPVFASSTALATVIAVALSMLFRIGLAKQSTLRVIAGEDNFEAIDRFLEEQGAAWGMRKEVVTRAISGTHEFLANAGLMELRSPEVKIDAQFDEFRLDVEITYDGPPLEFSQSLPSLEDLSNGAGVPMLAHFLIREAADQVKMKRSNGLSILCLHFDH